MMEKLNWLKKKILLFKEHIIIFAISLFAIVWSLFQYGMSPKTLNEIPIKSKIKKEIITEEFGGSNFIINLVKPEKLFTTIKDGQINSKSFISTYKNEFKKINIKEGKGTLLFTFFENKNKTNNVKIEITFILKDGKVIKEKQIIKLKINN